MICQKEEFAHLSQEAAPLIFLVGRGVDDDVGDVVTLLGLLVLRTHPEVVRGQTTF